MSSNPEIQAKCGRHFLAHSLVYTSIKGDLSSFLSIPIPSSNSHPKVDRYLSKPLPNVPEVIERQHPYIALLPLHNVFRGSLFSRLIFDEKQVRKVPGGGWALQFEIVQDWHRLECTLRFLLNAMLNVYIFLPKDFARCEDFPAHQPRSPILRR